MYPQPDLSAALNTIGHLNNDQLKELLNDDEKFDDMMKNLQQFKSLEQEREMLLVSITSLSEFNIMKEPTLVEGREKIEERSSEGEELSLRVQEKMEEYRKKSGNMSTDTALALLQTAAAEMEEESETIAQNFLSSDLDIEDFLTQFAERRKIMHLRKVKVEKMSELIRQPLLNHAPNYINAPPVSINSNFFPSVLNTNSVPYPTGPMHMPLPNSYFQQFN